MERKLKISFIGVKGIPAKWGGIEVYVEEVAKRLVERGHAVNVYSRRWYGGNLREHMGIRIIKTPTIIRRATDALIHGLTSSVHACFADSDIVHYHGLGSYFFSFLPRIAGKKVIGTIHSADWTNPKWGALAKNTLRAGLWFALRFPHGLTVVAGYLKEQLKGQRDDIVYTPCGITLREKIVPNEILKYSLRGSDYALFMGRFEEQKRIDWIIRAYRELGKRNLKLVIAGGSSHSDGPQYDERLRSLADDDKDIIFTGYVTGELKEELVGNAALIVLPSEVEGLPLTLLEALSYGRRCIVSDIPANREFIESGLVHHFRGDYGAFKSAFGQALDVVKAVDPEWRAANKAEYVSRNFSWESTVDSIENLYVQVTRGGRGKEGKGLPG